MKACRILFIAISMCIAGSLWVVAAHPGQSSTNFTIPSSVIGGGGSLRFVQPSHAHCDRRAVRWPGIEQ
jgi:hypothetical protein